jgi:DNA-binding NarL/FixJ family response regulator
MNTNLAHEAWKQILTHRQHAILQDRLNGHSWRTIATAYGIHEATARGHHRAALARLERARKEAA